MGMIWREQELCAVPGVFISLEGGDGCGKSTQSKLLIQALEQAGGEVIYVREPGGTSIGEQVRTVLLDPANIEMVPEAELLLYEASRAQLTRQIIEPAMAQGKLVLADRYYDSSFAYQHAGHGLDEMLVREANRLGSCGLKPMITLVFDLDPALAHSRATEQSADRLEAEGLELQRRVREGYIRLSKEEPERIHLIDASGAPEEIFARVMDVLLAAHVFVPCEKA